MTSQSNVGNSQTYGNDDQRNQEEPQVERFEEGKENSHDLNDSKDQRSIANRLAAAEKADKEDDDKTLETKRLQQDATLPAKAHGNKPSRGAVLDQELRDEEQEYLERKGKA